LAEKLQNPIAGLISLPFQNKLPVNLLVGAYYDALRPTGAGTWQLRTHRSRLPFDPPI
jgi:hypothetical protein